MTELQKQIIQLTEEIDATQNKRSNLKNERVKESEFEKDEIVDVYSTSNEYLGKGLVLYISVLDNGDFKYNLKKIKKDGGISRQRFCQYTNYIVKKIEK